MTVKKIALIETKAVKTHVFSRVYAPRLGLPILCGVLRKAGYEVELFLQDLKPLDIDYLMTFDMVGLSSITSTVKEAYRLGAIFKEKGQRVVMGGAHASAMADDALNYCDYVVRGEGEVTFLKLLDALNNNSDLLDVPAISFRKNGTVVHNPSPVTKVNLEQLPATDFSACKSFSGPEEYPGGLMFSRGCPYDCNFCSVTTTFGRKYRHKTVDQIMKDLEPLAGRTITFIDDNFAAIPKKTKELLRAMLKSKHAPLRYSCQLRINTAKDEELLDLMSQTKCRIAYVGLESINPETLKQYHKGQTVEQMVSSIKVFRKYGIGLHGMFVLGADNDTLQTVTDTADFAMDMGLDTIQLCALTPFPGTAVYEEMMKEGRVLHRNWDLYDGLHVVTRPKKMTPYELQLGIIENMKRFYTLMNAFKINLRKRWRFKYRIGARYLVKRWIEENQDYFDYLKNLKDGG